MDVDAREAFYLETFHEINQQNVFLLSHSFCTPRLISRMFSSSSKDGIDAELKRTMDTKIICGSSGVEANLCIVTISSPYTYCIQFIFESPNKNNCCWACRNFRYCLMIYIFTAMCWVKVMGHACIDSPRNVAFCVSCSPLSAQLFTRHIISWVYP